MMILSFVLVLAFPNVSFAKHTAGTQKFHMKYHFTYSQSKKIVKNASSIKNITDYITAFSALSKSQAGAVVGVATFLYGKSIDGAVKPFKTAVSKHKSVYFEYDYYLPPTGPGSYEHRKVYYK